MAFKSFQSSMRRLLSMVTIKNIQILKFTIRLSSYQLCEAYTVAL